MTRSRSELQELQRELQKLKELKEQDSTTDTTSAGKNNTGSKEPANKPDQSTSKNNQDVNSDKQPEPQKENTNKHANVDVSSHVDTLTKIREKSQRITGKASKVRSITFFSQTFLPGQFNKY